uniref:Defective in cullin neddylation protein n=1 Tax=Steinernema glaseri TaxID=37863 RepID=A0A1I7ZNB1_9BILA
MEPVQGNTKQNALFRKYTGKDEGCDGARIGPNGCAKLLADLGLDVTDRRVLVLCALAKAETQCEFSYEELVGAFKEYKINYLGDLKK